MMRTLALIAVFVCVAAAQLGTDIPESRTIANPMHPASSRICSLSNRFKTVDKSSFYKSSFNKDTSVCVKDYLEVCATVNGLVPCNKHTHVCVAVDYAFADEKLYPASAAVMAKAPEICVEEGSFDTPDSDVLVIAQILFSGIFMISTFIIFAVRVQVEVILIVLCGVFLFICLLLLFSYYYLNGILVFMSALAASTAFSLKYNEATAVGIAIVLGTLYWVTYESGLGAIQHHSRFSAGGIETDFYEQKCNQYYNGRFYYPAQLHSEDENIAVKYQLFCNRSWLAAELFFMIAAEQLLVLLIAIGASVHLAPAAVVVEEEEVVKVQQ